MGPLGHGVEQLGLHRDGSVLGLSPIETEKRPGLWWQLQYLDIILAIKNGVTPVSFSVDWDTRLPLNIEDYDLPTSQSVPQGRKGLARFSNPLFTY